MKVADFMRGFSYKGLVILQRLDFLDEMVLHFLFYLCDYCLPTAWITFICYWLKQAGIALGELRSLSDLYDFQAIATLFFIGIISVTPTLMSKSQAQGTGSEKTVCNGS